MSWLLAASGVGESCVWAVGRGEAETGMPDTIGMTAAVTKRRCAQSSSIALRAFLYSDPPGPANFLSKLALHGAINQLWQKVVVLGDKLIKGIPLAAEF
jgi:hypothetical protein